VVPFGTETVALAPGTVTEALPLGTETLVLAPGNDTSALPPGTDADALPPGTFTVAVPPGAETVTGLDPVPRDGSPESPPVGWASPFCEPPVVAGACCSAVVEPVLAALPDAVPAFLAPWRPIAGVEMPGKGFTFAPPPACGVRAPWRLIAGPAASLLARWLVLSTLVTAACGAGALATRAAGALCACGCELPAI
jgi:hypothetical protein